MAGKLMSATALVVAAGLCYLALGDNQAKVVCSRSADGVGKGESLVANKASGGETVVCQEESRR
jgi:hypothetical protein